MSDAAELRDGRLLVAEYKGALSNKADNRKKQNIGPLLAETSNGAVVFVWLERER